MQILIIVGVIDKIFEDFEQGFISCLHLIVTLWEIWARKVVMDVKGSAQFLHIYVYKISSMVCENGSWDAKAIYDMIQDKFGNLNARGSNKENCFNPLSEVISGVDYPLVAL